LPLPAGLVVAIAFLALAAPASAANPVSDAVDTVAKTATPAVTQVVSAPLPVAPTPAAAQQAGDVAPRPVPVDRTVEHTTGSLTTSTANAVRSELPATTSHHDPTQAGPPAYQPESALRSEEGPHASGATTSRDIGSGATAGATPSIASPRHPSDPAGVVVHGVALAASEVAPGVSHLTDPLPADRPLPPQLPDVATAGTPAHAGPPDAVRGVVLSQTLTPLLLSEPTVLLELPSLSTLPLLGTVPSLPTLPALTAPPQSEPSPTPVSTPAPSPASSTPSPPIVLSPPAGATRGGDVTPTAAIALRGAWLASSVVQAYVATANGIRGVKGASDRQVTTSSAVGALRRATSWGAGTTAYAHGLSTSDGTAPAAPDTTSSGDAYEQPSPAPSPGSASAATGAVAGTSNPIFLTLVGLLLLAAPRARRLLRLLGESWRLSPLALILERPG
jgi:hypothetical protein